MKMKKLILPLRLLLIAVLIAAVALTIVSCGQGTGTGTQKATEAVTEDGTGTEAATEAPIETEKVDAGEGDKTITVNVKKDNKVTILTIKTDAENLADALTENELASGSVGEYGLLITEICGIEADNVNNFWSLEQNGEMLMAGASSTPISDGETFDFVFTALSAE